MRGITACDRHARRGSWLRTLGSAVLVTGLLGSAGCDGRDKTDDRVVRVGVAASAASLVESAVADGGAIAATVAVHVAGSGVLVEQVRHGAPIDIVVLADVAWMDLLVRDGFVVPASRRRLAGNEAVMVFADKDVPTRRTDGVRWVTADPATAPLGAVAHRGFRAIGWTDDDLVGVRLVEDAVAAFRSLANGDADAAILYATDAGRLGGDWIVRRFPDEAATQVWYEVAIVRDSAGARRVWSALSDPAVRVTWAKSGFIGEDIDDGRDAP